MDDSFGNLTNKQRQGLQGLISLRPQHPTVEYIADLVEKGSTFYSIFKNLQISELLDLLEILGIETEPLTQEFKRIQGLEHVQENLTNMWSFKEYVGMKYVLDALGDYGMKLDELDKANKLAQLAYCFNRGIPPQYSHLVMVHTDDEGVVYATSSTQELDDAVSKWHDNAE